MREYIAYKGEKFSIEWYFDKRGKSQALEYYSNLSPKERIEVLKLFKRIGDIGEIKDTTKFNYEGDKIYAFKPQPDRFLCFFWRDGKVVVTNSFRKKAWKLPKNEKDKALDCKKGYEQRVKEGTYYE